MIIFWQVVFTLATCGGLFAIGYWSGEKDGRKASRREYEK